MAVWKRTKIARGRLKKALDRNGNYLGRHLIERDTQIDGGVSLGGGPREAIVVDSRKSPRIRELYQKAKLKSTRKGFVFRSEVLEAAYQTTLEALPIQCKTAVGQLLDDFDIKDDQKISLGRFIERGVGVCRQSALLVGVLLELFKKEGYIRGEISADRNQTKKGAHEWVRYTSYHGNVMILDVTQKYFGTLEQSIIENRWPYQRLTDIL